MQSSRAVFSSLQTQQGYIEVVESVNVLALPIMRQCLLEEPTLGFSVWAGWVLGSVGAAALSFRAKG